MAQAPDSFQATLNLTPGESDSAAARRLMRWAGEAWRLLRPSSDERIYANYQSHAGKGSAEAVFGTNLSRLVALKNKYDPTNFFRRNSNVEPSKVEARS